MTHRSADSCTLDRSLLERKMFVEAFSLRVQQPFRRTHPDERNLWLHSVAEELKKDNELVLRATEWLKSTFPHTIDATSDETLAVEHLALFVEGLWILSGEMDQNCLPKTSMAEAKKNDRNYDRWLYCIRKKMGEGDAGEISRPAQVKTGKRRRASSPPQQTTPCVQTAAVRKTSKAKTQRKSKTSKAQSSGSRGGAAVAPPNTDMPQPQPITASQQSRAIEESSVEKPHADSITTSEALPSGSAISEHPSQTLDVHHFDEANQMSVDTFCGAGTSTEGQNSEQASVSDGLLLVVEPMDTCPSVPFARDEYDRPSSQSCGDHIARNWMAESEVIEQTDVPIASMASQQPGQLDALDHSSFKAKSEQDPQESERSDDTALRLPFLQPMDVLELEKPEQPTQLETKDSTTLEPKKCLPRYPPIWSQSRQEICETFNWFRSYQGGVYYKDGFAKGYLLSGFAANRDIFASDGLIIISHGGGKAESLHSSKGQTEKQLASDQLAQDKSVRALLENYERQRPLVLLVDDKYALFPWNLSSREVTYAVLGFYLIKDAWAEYQPAMNEAGRVVRYKFAFQWCSNQGAPWWFDVDQERSYLAAKTSSMSNASPISDSRSHRKLHTMRTTSATKINHPSCSDCSLRSPSVFMQGWMCLNPKCKAFWTLLNGSSPSDNLHYKPEFLIPGAEPPLLHRTEDLIPANPIRDPSNGVTTDEGATVGWYCADCGRVSCRSRWEMWHCSNCQAQYLVKGSLRIAREFRSLIPPVPWRDHGTNIVDGSGITLKESFTYNSGGNAMALCEAFELPHARGQIIHIRAASPISNKEADRIFEDYQTQASNGTLPFRRWPLRSHKLRGPMLTHYFSQNTGVPYQYVGGSENTISFDDVPSAVQRARELICLRIKQALKRESQFNEVLSCAYMVKQKMAFHSDAEAGLGPLIAGLSLGAPALMHFRPHYHHEHDPSKRGIALSIILRHGDVLVMDGLDVQKYYEHTVIPTNFRIAATARDIHALRA
ncbi:hypothetical protein HGRIS_002472 [Hohenbuehelia grisea]|uniref:Alpha-ketoglutarate-dependent dioxygenase AlkB-like domain-containing protein n=1 Tax=Hohenbuehelia grisea TaxID=104357 RepID=A0ABR3JL29_9AGAR